ncbi:MAG: RrF2 family transcriptional regulator [Acidiferrobacter sp.]
MRIGEGVEWGLHCCLTLAWIGNQEPVSTAKLAAHFGVPPTYLNKCLQALVRAGILTSVAGVHGGFQLAKAPAQVTLMEVVAAIEGPDEAFRCTEIRQSEGCSRKEYRQPCAIAAAMHQAEVAWRAALSAQTLADIMTAAPTSAAERTRRWYTLIRR